jgi:hypothetical protein
MAAFGARMILEEQAYIARHETQGDGGREGIDAPPRSGGSRRNQVSAKAAAALRNTGEARP